MHALVVASLSMVWAPAPAYKPVMTKEMESLLREADRYREEARRVQHDAFLGHTLTPEQKKAMLKEASRLHRSAAGRYTKLSEMMEKKRPYAGARSETDDIAMRAGRAWYEGGEMAKSLAAYEGVADRSPDARKRVQASGGCVAALEPLGKEAEIGRRLAAIRKDLPLLADAERDQWERWLNAAEGSRQKR